MVFFVYNLLLFLILPLLLGYHGYRSMSRGRRTAFGERFGSIPEAELAPIRGRRTLLVHAVSVGETIAALPLLKALKLQYPDHALVLSNVTETGRSVALKSGVADLCIYFPFDYPFAVSSVLKRIRPELVVIMETELWPNFIARARGLGIPVLLANGRISDRSFRRYLKFSWFFRPILQQLSALCMQTGDDASRITAIGAPAQAVRVVGNLKYDIPIRLPAEADAAELRRAYAIPSESFVFTGASTHPGEEEQVLAAYRSLLEQDRQSFLVLVPRHPERAGAVAELVRGAGLPFRLRSALVPGMSPIEPGGVLLLDTVGELGKLFAVSDLVFMGGSLVPTGGHNPLEPAACGVPVLFGPHMENFREIAALFLKYGAGARVPDQAGLSQSVTALASNHVARKLMGLQGVQILQDSAGSTLRHQEAIADCLAGAARG